MLILLDIQFNWRNEQIKSKVPIIFFICDIYKEKYYVKVPPIEIYVLINLIELPSQPSNWV